MSATLAATWMSGLLMATASPAAAVEVPRLRWAPCPKHAALDCARARVPLSYRHPGGAKIRLAVVRHRAGDPSRRMGTLFFNPGGPAAAKPILPAIVQLLPRQVARRFDVITWDPRGHGGSTAVQCFRSRAVERRFLAGVGRSDGNTFPVGAAQMRRWIKRYASFGRHCKRRSGRIIRHMSTADSARDMELLRRGVGAHRLNYYGLSYGTLLGATYANLFPSRVKAMVLDGDANPKAWFGRRPGTPRGSPLRPSFLRQRSDVGSRVTLNAFLDLCGRASRARCAFSAGNAAATRAKFAELLRRLPSKPSRRTPTYAELVSSAINGGYVIATWSGGARALQRLWNSLSGRPTRSLRGAPAPRPAMAGRAAIADRLAASRYASAGQQLGTICGESPNPRASAFPAADTFASDRSGFVGAYWTWITEACATWPVRALSRYSGPWNRRTANPVLLLNTTTDPATPLQGAIALSRQLRRARLLTVDGYGHTAFLNPSRCTHAYTVRYLIKGILPPPGKHCRGPRPFAKGR
ncbi:MAG: alpha/beta hydrolase [Solirubrobacterales bacterium]